MLFIIPSCTLTGINCRETDLITCPIKVNKLSDASKRLFGLRLQCLIALVYRGLQPYRETLMSIKWVHNSNEVFPHHTAIKLPILHPPQPRSRRSYTSVYSSTFIMGLQSPIYPLLRIYETTFCSKSLNTTAATQGVILPTARRSRSFRHLHQ